MDHKAFIETLPPNTLSALNETADGPGLRHLAGHAGLILFLGLWIAMGWFFWPLALVAQGIAICFLFTLQHETTHKTPFANEPINEWVGRVCGVLIVQPFEWFRYFHLAHHRHTNIPGKDPELLAGAKPETVGAYLWHVTGLPFWISMFGVVLRNALGRTPGDYVPRRAYARIKTEARWLLVIYVGVLVSLFLSSLLFWVWLLPCLLGQPFLRLYLLAEHGRCPFVADMLQNTRTTYTNRIVRFLAWNMPYHAEHHTLPQVPFHKLPVLHAYMQGRHKVTSDGYAAFTAEYTQHLK